MGQTDERCFRRLRRIENDAALVLEIVEQKQKPAPDLRKHKKLAFWLSVDDRIEVSFWDLEQMKVRRG